jgi:hypothetical protein
MNFLTEGQPMCRLSKFFRGTDTENLFGDGIMPENLNDDAMARILDMIADADSGPVLGTVLVEDAAREGVATDVVHAHLIAAQRLVDALDIALYTHVPDYTHGAAPQRRIPANSL